MHALKWPINFARIVYPGGWIHAFLETVTGLDQDMVRNCSITKVGVRRSCSDGGDKTLVARVLCVNDTAHLGDSMSESKW